MTFFLKRAPIVVAALVSLSLSAGFAAPALAQNAPAAQPTEVSPEAMDLARKFVSLTDQGGLYETTVVQAGINTYQQLLQTNPEIQKPLNDAITAVISTYKDKKSDLFDQMARLYAIAFSVDELKEIVAFYGTPTGIKLSKANADMGASMQKILQVFAQNLSKEFLAKVRAELKSKGIDV